MNERKITQQEFIDVVRKITPGLTGIYLGEVDNGGAIFLIKKGDILDFTGIRSQYPYSMAIKSKRDPNSVIIQGYKIKESFVFEDLIYSICTPLDINSIKRENVSIDLTKNLLDVQ